MAIGRLTLLGLLAVTAMSTALLAEPGRPVIVHAGPVVRGEALADATSLPTPAAATTQPLAENKTSQPDSPTSKEKPNEGLFHGPGQGKPPGADNDVFSRLVGPTWWALALVIGLIFLAAYVLKRIRPGSAVGRQGGLFRILGRWRLSGRANQYVALLQVGRRVLLVGVTAQQISLLSEITDPAEIEHLAANCPAGPGRSILGDGFSQLLGRQRKEMADAGDEAAPPASSASEALGRLGSTIDRAKGRVSNQTSGPQG